MSDSLLAHTVTDNDAPPEFGAGLLNPMRDGTTFQVDFYSSGTYSYKCAIHGFTGTSASGFSFFHP